MIRTALKPGWLALLAVLVVVVIAFSQLGMWQLGVSSNAASREFARVQAARPTVGLSEVVEPHQVFPADGAGRSIQATGSYVADLQFLVPNRLLEGQPGFWVVTPLRTEASGGPALLPVVRGFISTPVSADLPGWQRVTVTGTLAPSESPGASGLPEGQRGAIDTADLANDWDEPLYNAFIFLVEEEPSVTSTQVVPVPPPVFGESGIVWRNVGYGLQWFVFAVFAIYMYYRFLREAALREQPQGHPESTSPPGPPDSTTTVPAPSTLEETRS